MAGFSCPGGVGARVAGAHAEARMDNLNGDLEKLGGSFETLFIKSGRAADACRGPGSH